MHPAGLYTYARALIRLAKETNLQIIASTHSIDLVYIVQAISKELNVALALLYLEGEDGVLKVRNFFTEDVDILEGLGVDVRLLHNF